MEAKMPGYEKRKVAIDLFKHLTTLSLAAIAVIASFFQRLMALEEAGKLISFSAASFFTCVVFAVIACLILLAHIESLPKIHGSALHNILRLSIFLSLCGFIVGVGCLAWLVIKNVA